MSAGTVFAKRMMQNLRNPIQFYRKTFLYFKVMTFDSILLIESNK